MRMLMIVSIASAVSLCAAFAQAASPGTHDPGGGISFSIPSGSWRRTAAEPGFEALFRDRAGSEIRVAQVAVERGSGIKRALERAASLRGISISEDSVSESELGGQEALVSGFELAGRRGAVIAVAGEQAFAAVMCESAPDRFAALFLSCRELAASLIVTPPPRDSAPALYAGALDVMGSNPAEARRRLESAIRADPSFAPAYPAFGRALLAEGASAEMVSARLERMLARAPDTPEIRLMRERLSLAR